MSLRVFLFLSIFFSAHIAMSFEDEFLASLTHVGVMQRALPDLTNLKWKVGDFQERRIKSGIIRAGTLKSWVDREEGKAFWLLNELKIIFKKKQFIEALIDRKTGEILKYIVDGEEKDPPDIAKMDKCEELEEVNEKIKVPVGTFDSVRTILRCDEDVLAIWTTGDKSVNMGGHIRQAVLDEEENPKKTKYLVELEKFGHKD